MADIAITRTDTATKARIVGRVDGIKEEAELTCVDSEGVERLIYSASKGMTEMDILPDPWVSSLACAK